MNLSFIVLTVYENKSCYFKFRNMVDSTILSVEVYNTISGSIQYYQWKYTKQSVEVYNTISRSIQCYQWKYTILSVDVYNTISGSIQYCQWKYTILSAEVQYTILSVEVYDTISMQYYQWKYTILHSMYSVGARQLWLRVRVPFVDSLLNIQRNSSSITKDHSTDPQSRWPPGIYLWNYAIFFSLNS